MGGIIIPIILTIAALIAAVSAYRGIRRGGARFYTLERESMLRRAGFTLIGSVLLFLAAIILLAYNNQQMSGPNEISDDESDLIEVTETSETVLDTQPPTPTPTSTPDPNIPTPSPTPIICRAIVEGTAGSGLTLRDAPSGGEVAILPDGSILTLLEEDPVEDNGFIWHKVRTVARDEGWVAEEFLKFGDCN
jgi:hypothetical protein